MTTDVRDIDGARRDGVLAALAAAAQQVSARRGVTITTELVNADPPTTCDPGDSGGAGGLGHGGGQDVQEDGRRAYHDSSFVSCIAPVAMLFIPCRGGVSHRPDEYASPEWIGSGVHVLARTLASWQNSHLCLAVC